MLRQAFLNLAINACQAMPSGGTLRLVGAPASAEPRRGAGRGYRRRYPSRAPRERSLTCTSRRRIMEPESACRWSTASSRCTTARWKCSRRRGAGPRSGFCCHEHRNERIPTQPAALFPQEVGRGSRGNLGYRIGDSARERGWLREGTCRKCSRRPAAARCPPLLKRVLAPVEEPPLVAVEPEPEPPTAAVVPPRPARPTPEPKPAPPAAAAPATLPPPAPSAPPRDLRPASPPNAVAPTERGIRDLLARAARDINQVNYSRLSTEGRSQYEQSKRFSIQAEQALQERNLIFAETLADKAATLAAELLGR